MICLFIRFFILFKEFAHGGKSSIVERFVKVVKVIRENAFLI